MALRPPEVVVLRALGLGDLLTAVPALRAIARAFPREPPVLVTTGAMAPLAARFGLVRVSVAAPLGPIGPALAGAAVAVNLHGRGPESHRRLINLRPQAIIAFGNEHAGVAGPCWRAGEHEVHRWCRLLEESGIPADPRSLDIDLGPGPPPPIPPDYSVVHPGASAPARRWPAERWAEVARVERTQGRFVVVTGSRAETRLAFRVAAGAGLPASSVLAGRTTLCELAAVVRHAGRVVCGDTGVGHLATALSVPSVVLFGPVPPSEWGPPHERPWHRPLWAGRRGDPNGGEVDPGLLEITAAEVSAALEGLPGPQGPLAPAAPARALMR